MTGGDHFLQTGGRMTAACRNGVPMPRCQGSVWLYLRSMRLELARPSGLWQCAQFVSKYPRTRSNNGPARGSSHRGDARCFLRLRCTGEDAPSCPFCKLIGSVTVRVSIVVV